jgi:hypothetical protein
VVLAIDAEKTKAGRMRADLQDRRNIIRRNRGSVLSARRRAEKECQAKDRDGKKVDGISSTPQERRSICG